MCKKTRSLFVILLTLFLLGSCSNYHYRDSKLTIVLNDKLDDNTFNDIKELFLPIQVCDNNSSEYVLYNFMDSSVFNIIRIDQKEKIYSAKPIHDSSFWNDIIKSISKGGGPKSPQKLKEEFPNTWKQYNFPKELSEPNLSSPSKRTEKLDTFISNKISDQNKIIVFGVDSPSSLYKTAFDTLPSFLNIDLLISGISKISCNDPNSDLLLIYKPTFLEDNKDLSSGETTTKQRSNSSTLNPPTETQRPSETPSQTNPLTETQRPSETSGFSIDTAVNSSSIHNKDFVVLDFYKRIKELSDLCGKKSDLKEYCDSKLAEVKSLIEEVAKQDGYNSIQLRNIDGTLTSLSTFIREKSN